MKDIEIPMLDFSLPIFTVLKRIFIRKLFNFICLDLKNALGFNVLDAHHFYQAEKAGVNVSKIDDKTGLLLRP